VGINADWLDAIPEKMTKERSGAIGDFAEAYQLTADTQWLDYASNVKDYMDEFLRAEDGTYYNSQDMYHKPGSTKLYDRSFYKLGDKQRRAIAIPTIDKTVYTDINAQVIINFVSMYTASGDQSFLDDAINIAQILIKSRRLKEGWFKHLLVAPAKLQISASARPHHILNSLFIFVHRPGWAVLYCHYTASVVTESG